MAAVQHNIASTEHIQKCLRMSTMVSKQLSNASGYLLSDTTAAKTQQHRKHVHSRRTMARAPSDILSNSSMQQMPWSLSTSAPLSSTCSPLSGSFVTYAVKPTAEEPRPEV